MIQVFQNLGLEPTEVKPNWLQVRTEQGLKLELKGFVNKTAYRVVAGNNLPEEVLLEMSEYLEGWEKAKYWISKKVDSVVVAEEELQLAIEAFEATGYEVESTSPKQYGVTFEGTNFENYGERDFMAAVTQITKQGFKQYLPTGRNLVHEYVAAADSRIDAVELDENGNVITVIECQSGIQNGEYLDAVHFEKSISRYPYLTGAKRVVIIAGGYTEAQLETFAQLPFEVVTLTTTVVDGQVDLV